MKSLQINAHAKINIGLEIINKRKDGFHNINTIFSPVCLSDIITIDEITNPLNSKNKHDHSVQIECLPSVGIPQKLNLAYKAATLLIEKYNLNSKHIKISIQKNIPSGAGLGGGSSDAASVLRGLINFWQLPIEIREIKHLALQIGSDVPYFLSDGTAAASGRGEVLDYFDYKIPFNILIVMPDLHISTKWAYESINHSTTNHNPINFKKILLDSIENPALLKEQIFNDFESIVFTQYPEISKIKDTLYKSKAVYAQLSGSGSAIFGFFDNIKDAQKAMSQLNQYHTHLCLLNNN